MANPTDELEAMAVRLECDNWFDAAAMLRARKSGDASCGDWLAEESEHATLIYRLKEDGWRKGVPPGAARLPAAHVPPPVARR